MRVLFASDWADPRPVGSNRLVAAQAGELRNQGIDVELLTWPHNGGWSGPVPDASSPKIASMPVLRTVREGVPATVLALPPLFAERFPNAADWERMVTTGVELLRVLKPELLHVFFWQGHGYLLESARRAGIPAVYTACDYGLLCHRTLLVTGSNEPCAGPHGVASCSWCVVRGRGALGLANELAATIPPMRPLLALAAGHGNGPLAKRGGVALPVYQRVGELLARSRLALSSLAALVVTSPFAEELFRSAGAAPKRVARLPWFSARSVKSPLPPLPAGAPLRIGAACRISPEKGLHTLLEAACGASTARPLVIEIAGSRANEYARTLHARFERRAGPHEVRWHEWLSPPGVVEFVESLHAVAVPSEWADNTPLALVEALAIGRPVICTDLASMTHLARDEVNALTFPFADARGLSTKLERLAGEDGLLQRLAANTGGMPSLEAHCANLAALYREILPA